MKYRDAFDWQFQIDWHSWMIGIAVYPQSWGYVSFGPFALSWSHCLKEIDAATARRWPPADCHMEPDGRWVHADGSPLTVPTSTSN